MKQKKIFYRVLAKMPLAHKLELQCEETGKVFYFKLSRCESIRDIEVGQTIAVEWAEVSKLNH